MFLNHITGRFLYSSPALMMAENIFGLTKEDYLCPIASGCYATSDYKSVLLDLQFTMSWIIHGDLGSSFVQGAQITFYGASGCKHKIFAMSKHLVAVTFCAI